VFEHFRAAGGDPHLLEPVLGVDAAYLHAGLDEMKQRFGSIEGYFADGLGINEDGQQRLREALIESEGE
jgi:protein-tyrosine phosphatase